MPGGRATYDRIIIALDGSTLAEQILPYVEALAEKFGSTLTLVRAMMPVEQIAKALRQSQADLIALTTHGAQRTGAAYLRHCRRWSPAPRAVPSADSQEPRETHTPCPLPEAEPAEHPSSSNGALTWL